MSHFNFEGHFYGQSPSYSCRWISEIHLQIIGSLPFPVPSEQKKGVNQNQPFNLPTFFPHFRGRQPATFKVFQFEGGPPTSATIFRYGPGRREEKGARKTGMNMKPLPENSFGIPILFKTCSLQKSKRRMHDFKEKLLLLYVQHHIHH